MPQPMSFQSVILELQKFWAEQGCVIWQPYHTEVGAGTMSPATFLRVLGPEPWWVAYVEPSIRPADGRYGANPNRWQHFYQFQVILKPDPGDPQELYLRSLVALGVNPQEHDIRFVEDNWESPALGAWGLGWEVWLDGQEITQFTYFQQAGGEPCDPVSVEITYGIERIVMAIQGVESFVDIRWNELLTYGDIALQSEVEFSRYNFEAADVERLRTIYEEYEAEAKSSLERGLTLPAHDYILKCSHTFNILDARGAIGVAERAALFGRMRELAREVAEQYLSQREAAGYPWKEKPPLYFSPLPLRSVKANPVTKAPSPLLVEVGTEELPSRDLEAALGQLNGRVGRLLDELRLPHGLIRIMGTPRRLVIYIEELAIQQEEQVILVKGPPADRAFDSQGQPTKAAMGFAKSKGVPVEALEIRELDGGRYAVAEVRHIGLPTREVLGSNLSGLLTGLRFERSMRWDGEGMIFSRPIRWLVALHGDEILPFSLAGLQASGYTHLLRFKDPEWAEIKNPQDYLEEIEKAGIILDMQERKDFIWKQIENLAGEVGGTVIRDEELLTEVTNMTEAPTTFRGNLRKEDLTLPRQVLISVMKNHQRYFPVEKDGRLLPYFIALRNGGDQHLDLVRYGNEQVIRARFADAAYFIRRDLERPLETYLSQLATLTFQTDLGSMLDKAERVEKIVLDLGSTFNLNVEERSILQRAATLCKADLATLMVIEMTSLQGEMGREYALRSGEQEQVAQAIFEHYLPRYSGDQLPQSRPGLILGIADRLDSLMGLFSVGMQPSGTSDPFGLRRMAIGLVQSLAAHQIRLNLEQGLRLAAKYLPVRVEEERLQACLSFIIARQQVLLLSEGKKHDVVESVLAQQGHDPAGVITAVDQLQVWTERPDWPQILQAYARCARITRGLEEVNHVVDEGLVEPEEIHLYKQLLMAERAERAPGSVDDFLQAFLPLIPAITSFFDEVLVMEEDQTLRSNRLALLQRIVALAKGVVDLSKLEGF